MKRSTLPALALALALPLAAVQVAPLPEADAQTATVNVNSTEVRARLAAQAIEEMINEYREANGLHPLVTHKLYDEQALAWSRHMIADQDDPHWGKPQYDSKGAMVAPGSFRHSDMKKWGHSGENIIVQGYYADTYTEWKRVAEQLFEGWRNSPVHNENLLRADAQGMGLGLVRDEDGNVWGTTMFFIDAIPVNVVGERGEKWLSADDVTKSAKNSGAPFYVPEGARARLGVGAVAQPRDTKGYAVTYDIVEGSGKDALQIRVLRTSANGKLVLDKAASAARGLDPVAGGTAGSVSTPGTGKPSSAPTSSAPKPHAQTPPAPKSHAQTPPAPTSVAQPSTTPAVPELPQPPKPTPTLKEIPSKTGGTSTATATETVTATAAANSTTAQQPTEEQPAPADEQSSSTAGIVAGVVAALLVALGAAAVALPMVAPDLAAQLGLPRIG